MGNGSFVIAMWSGKKTKMEFKRVPNGKLASISYRISKWDCKNRLEIKHENACKQTQIPQEYAKVSNASIPAQK